jgi:predicted nucleic acid-binding protein
MKLVLDSSVIIAFYTELNKPELMQSLINLGHELIIPLSVLEEIKKGQTITRLQPDVNNQKITIRSKLESEINRLNRRYPSLHKGEIEVILWGLSYNNSGEQYLCIIDDKQARQVALKNKIKITGTIGLLKMLSDAGLISESERENLVKQLTGLGFRLKHKP